MIIAQITDFHVAVPGDPIDTKNKTAAHLAAAIAHINGMYPLPDVVLATGDLVNQGNAEEYALLRQLLMPLTPPLLMIPGNHDERQNLRNAFPEHTYLNQDPEYLHYTIEHFPLRLIGLDTVIPGEAGGELCQQRCDWLDSRLSEKPDTPTVVFLHHPPFRTGLWHMDHMGLSGADRLAAVVIEHPQIERILCGHLHRPITAGFAGTVATVAPGTAHQIELSLGENHRLAVVMEPPCCLIHAWMPGDGLVTHTSYIGEFGPTTVLAES